MTVSLPTPAQLAAVAESIGLDLTDADIASFLGLLAPSIAAYNLIVVAGAVASSMAMYGVLRRLGVPSAIAFWAGLAYMVAPWHLDRAAIHPTLSLMAAHEHKHVKISSDDVVVISAHAIPGNETNVTRIARAIPANPAGKEPQLVLYLRGVGSTGVAVERMTECLRRVTNRVAIQT